MVTICSRRPVSGFCPAGAARVLDLQTARLGLSVGSIWRANLAAFKWHESTRPRIGIDRSGTNVPILGYGMSYVNIMAIDRTNRERAIKTMEAAADRIRSGISFGVFAEGTRAKPGQVLLFKKGAFYMAVQAGVPIVPVAIKNTDVLMGKGTGAARTGTIEMVLLPPISTEGIGSDIDVQRLIHRVQHSIAAELGVRKLTKR